MEHAIFFAPQAIQDLKRLSARDRAMVRDAIETHLQFEQEVLSQSRIKRLRGMRRPQYRLRVDAIRVYYDILDGEVEILAIIEKAHAAHWLAAEGESDENDSPI